MLPKINMRFLVVGLSVSLVAFLVWYTGLSCYVRAIAYVSMLQGEARDRGLKEFYGDPANGVYSGIVAFVRDGENPGVGVWTKQGLRFFGDSGTAAFSYYNACDDNGLVVIDSSPQGITLEREILFDIKDYKKKVGRCDFIKIQILLDNSTENNIREAWTNDWWSFRQTSMQKACKK